MAAQTGDIKGHIFTDEKNFDPVSNGLVRFQKFPPSLSSGFIKRRFEPETNLLALAAYDAAAFLLTTGAHSEKARGLNNAGLGLRLDPQDASATYRVRDARTVRRRVNDRDGGGATRVPRASATVPLTFSTRGTRDADRPRLSSPSRAEIGGGDHEGAGGEAQARVHHRRRRLRR